MTLKLIKIGQYLDSGNEVTQYYISYSISLEPVFITLLGMLAIFDALVRFAMVSMTSIYLI